MAMRRRPRAAAVKGSPGIENYAATWLQKALDVCVLLRLRDRMKQQLQDCSNAIQTDQISCLDHVIDEHFSKGAAEDLERVMEHITLNFQNKALALQRLQLGFHLKRKVKQYDNDSRLLIGSMKHITVLSRTVIDYQQQAREKEHKLIAIKRKRFSLKKSGEQKMLQIRTMIRKVKDKHGHVKGGKMVEAMRRNVQKERQKITLLQHIFQNILIGSKINWAENPSLKVVVLKLERNVGPM